MLYVIIRACTLECKSWSIFYYGVLIYDGLLQCVAIFATRNLLSQIRWLILHLSLYSILWLIKLGIGTLMPIFPWTLKPRYAYKSLYFLLVDFFPGEVRIYLRHRVPLWTVYYCRLNTARRVSLTLPFNFTYIKKSLVHELVWWITLDFVWKIDKSVL